MAVRFTVKFKGEDLGEFNSDEVYMDQALRLENEAKMTIDEMIKGLAISSARAVQAVVWFRLICLNRPAELHSNFRFGDFDVNPVEEDPVPDPTEATEVAALEEVFKK